MYKDDSTLAIPKDQFSPSKIPKSFSSIEGGLTLKDQIRAEMEREGLLVEDHVYNSQFILEANEDEEESEGKKSNSSIIFSDKYYKTKEKENGIGNLANYEAQISKNTGREKSGIEQPLDLPEFGKPQLPVFRPPALPNNVP